MIYFASYDNKKEASSLDDVFLCLKKVEKDERQLRWTCI